MSETEALPSLDRCRDIRPEIVSLPAPPWSPGDT
jgi:hypothetical protein